MKTQQALGNLMFFGAGLLFAVVGLIPLGLAVHSRLSGRRVTGVVAGVRAETRRKGAKMYYPVVDYDCDGAQRRAESASGTSGLLGMIPGEPISVLVSPGYPEECSMPGYGFVIAGLIFFIPGVFFCVQALKEFKGGLVPWLLAAVVLALIFARLARKLRSLAELNSKFISKICGKSRDEWRAKRAALPMLGREEVTQLARKQCRNTLIAAPLFLLLSLALDVTGLHFGQKTYDFMQTGTRVAGDVIALKSKVNSGRHNSTSYFAKISFADANGAPHKFMDNAGGNPPLYQVGDKVKVLYDPADPGHAIVDRGIWNMALPGALLLLGAFLLLVSVRGVVGGFAGYNKITSAEKRTETANNNPFTPKP